MPEWILGRRRAGAVGDGPSGVVAQVGSYRCSVNDSDVAASSDARVGKHDREVAIREQSAYGKWGVENIRPGVCSVPPA